MTIAMPRNVRNYRDKGTIGTRIIEATRVAVATVIGSGRETEENVVVGVNSNQNTVDQLKKMGSGTVVIGDGTSTTGDGNSLHYILRLLSVPECK